MKPFNSIRKNVGPILLMAPMVLLSTILTLVGVDTLATPATAPIAPIFFILALAVAASLAPVAVRDWKR